MNRTSEAKNRSDVSQIEERIKLVELSARMDNQGNLTYSDLNIELTKEFGEKGTGYTISDETEEIWTVKVGNVEYNISNENKEQIPNDKLEIAKAKIQEQVEDCMIDEDGNIMALNTWSYRQRDDRNGEYEIYGHEEDDGEDWWYESNYNPNNIQNGKLIYNIPVFIKINQNVYKVTALADGALGCLNNLSEVIIPESIDRIGNGAFDWDTSLTSAVIPDNVTNIGSQAFRGCRISIEALPKEIKYLGSGAFTQTHFPENFTIPGTISALNSDAFRGANFKNVTIQDGVEKIYDYAFMNCSNLESIIIPKSVNYMSPLTFVSCNQNFNIIIENGSQLEIPTGATKWGAKNATIINN